MTFKLLLTELYNGKSFEKICEEQNHNMVECVGNEVYEDDDLYNFLTYLGSEIEDFGVGYAVVSTTDGKYYEIPYEIRENRFGNDLPDETILFFDRNRIYDVTESYMYT